MSDYGNRGLLYEGNDRKPRGRQPVFEMTLKGLPSSVNLYPSAIRAVSSNFDKMIGSRDDWHCYVKAGVFDTLCEVATSVDFFERFEVRTPRALT